MREADGGPPEGAVKRQPSLRSVEDPRLPYRILTLLLLTCGVLAFLLALAPPTAQSLRALDLWSALALVLAAAALWFLGDRLPHGLSLDLAVLAGIAVASQGAAAVPTAVGQVLIGLGYVLFGVFLGYFRPPGRVRLLLAVMLVGYVTAVLVNSLLDTFIPVLIVCLVIVSVTLMTSHLVTSLRALALHDGLTGALNRRGLVVVAEPLAAAAWRAGQPVTVGLVDLDSFKAYNDEHGHLAGDAALIAVVQAWRSELRSADVLARYGGDEFALVLPATRQDDVGELVRRLEAAYDVAWTGGFVEWTPQEDLYAALGRADDLMFDRKPKRR